MTFGPNKFSLTDKLIVAADVSVFDHLELLSEMSRDFASSQDIAVSLKNAVTHITEYVQADGGALFLLDESGNN